jgi:uncharacterized protein (TIGR00255 family)
MDRLDPKVRAAVSRRVKRGNVTVGLQLSQASGTAMMRINRPWLDELIAIARDYQGTEGIAEPSLDGMLGLRGVIEPVEEEQDEPAQTRREAAMLEDLDAALDEFVQARKTEGSAIAGMLAARVAEITELTERADTLAAERLAPLGERLRAQVATLIGAGATVPEDRLAVELALLATKIDITEEIDRLKTHCAAATRHMAEEKAVGRKLDFLAQEFNREANTLCSKASDAALTDVGLEIKAAIDQFREQAQNVE